MNYKTILKSAVLGPVLFAGLSACSGGSTSTTSTNGTSTNTAAAGTAPFAFFGFPTQGEADANGVITGIPASAFTVVRDPVNAANGYTYAATTVANADGVAGSGGSTGQSAFIATSGLLPGTNVGSVPQSGTATFNGTYNLKYATVTADRSAPTAIEDASGNIVVTADFGSGAVSATTTPTSGGALTLTNTSTATLSAGMGNNLFMSTQYRGVVGLANGKIGSDGAIAAIGGGSLSGASTTGVYSGGFIAK